MFASEIGAAAVARWHGCRANSLTEIMGPKVFSRSYLPMKQFRSHVLASFLCLALLLLLSSKADAAQISNDVVDGIPVISFAGDIEVGDDEAFARAISGKPRGIIYRVIEVNLGKEPLNADVAHQTKPSRFVTCGLSSDYPKEFHLGNFIENY